MKDVCSLSPLHLRSLDSIRVISGIETARGYIEVLNEEVSSSFERAKGSQVGNTVGRNGEIWMYLREGDLKVKPFAGRIE